MSEKLDFAVLAAEKVASREADARAIASGSKSGAQVRSDNASFAFVNARIKFPIREK